MNYLQGLLPGLGLNYTMFQTAVETFSNDEQRKHWLPLIKNHKIMGCYT
jgi:acyl-CoA oxidase